MAGLAHVSRERRAPQKRKSYLLRNAHTRRALGSSVAVRQSSLRTAAPLRVILRLELRCVHKVRYLACCLDGREPYSLRRTGRHQLQRVAWLRGRLVHFFSALENWIEVQRHAGLVDDGNKQRGIPFVFLEVVFCEQALLLLAAFGRVSRALHALL